MAALDLVPVADCDPEEILAVIEQAFGRARGSDWFQWKHRDGPWGPSSGYAAVDRLGVAGVRLLLPWGLRVGGSNAIAHRAVEAATAPRAQGRGVFSRLNRALMEEAAGREDLTVMFSTPNVYSRGGYAKLGWRALPPVAHGYHLARRPWLTTTGDVVSSGDLEGCRNTWAGQEVTGIRTDWHPNALRWRIDPRGGNRYEVVHLRSADAPNGLVYRVLVRRAVRTLLLVMAWGPPAERSALIGGAARRERSWIVLDTLGPGGYPLASTAAFRRGDSLVMLWENGRRPGSEWPLFDVRRWRLSMADLERLL